MSMPTKVLITEVLLRDGLQIEPTLLPTIDKVRLVRALLSAGVQSLEVGSFVRPELVPQMADTGELVRTLQPDTIEAELHTLVFTESGAKRAIDAGVRAVRFVVSASDGHSRSNVGMTRDEALGRLEPAAALLSAAGVKLEGSVATAFICPFDGETDPAQVIRVTERMQELGASVVHLADTIGAASPWHIRRTVSAVQDAFPDLALGLHLHNTYGMASANAWEGLALGIERFDAALGGVGGCPFAPGAAGNIGTDDLVNLLHQAGIATGIDVTRLTEVRDELAQLLGHPLDSALSAVPAAPVMVRS